MTTRALLLAAGAALLAGCATAPTPETATPAPAAAASDVEAYLASYDSTYRRLYAASSDAEWASNTRIVPGDSTNAMRTRAANEALASFVGSVENIERIRGFLANRASLTRLQARRLESMLYAAGGSPQTVADVVRQRIAAEAAQTEKLYGFTFRIDGKAVTPNQLDSLLRASNSLAERRKAWESSKEVGPTLRSGLLTLRDLRNRVVQGLGYNDFFTYQVSDYGMTPDEMLAMNDNLIGQLRPLYRELHTWARYELARKYGAPVPDMLPADWLPNRWGQSWEAMVTVQGLNVDSALSSKSAEWVVKAGEEFYKSLGFAALPQSFWDKSSLYPLPADAPYKKNTHASAWHMDLAHDVRSLMSVEPNADWYETAAHELGHVYYYMSYTNPNVPVTLRGGANRAYHEGIGSMMGLAASQRRFLANRGLVPANAQVDQTRQLLKEALNYVIFIPFAAGTMMRWEHDFYRASLPQDRLNARWWELVRQYQGIVPPSARGEQFTDAATKTHINDDAAQYYDYALSYALLFQLHNHIAKNILQQDPHDTDYYGNRAVGDFLRTIMEPGQTRDWRTVLRETTGRELDGQAMVEYFAPLQAWLVEQNKGRKYTLPDL
jgi:peptidyl-dipeptidase A